MIRLKFLPFLAFVFGGLFYFASPVQAVIITTAGTGNWSATAWPNTARTGTITTSNSNPNVTGVGTSFTTELTVGNIIKTAANVNIGTISSITDDTHLTFTGNGASTNAGIAYHAQGVGPVDNVTIKSGHTITMDVAFATVTVLTVNNAGAATNLNISGTNHLTILSSTTCSAPTGANTSTIAIAAGTFASIGVLTINGGTAGTRICQVTQAAGTLTLGNGMTFAGTLAQAKFNNTATGGTINLVGTISGAAGLFTINPGTTLVSTAAATIGGAYTLGILSVPSGTLTLGAFAVTIASNTNISGGSLNVSSAVGTKTFAGFVNVTSGNFDLSGFATVTSFGGGIDMNGGGTFNSGTGNAAFSASQNLAGATNMTFGGSVTPAAAVTITNNNTGTVTVNGILTVTGNWIQGANSNLKLAAAPAFSGAGTLSASASGNTVEYSGTNQAVKAPIDAYLNLKLSGSTSIGAPAVVSGVLSVTGAGSFTPSTGTITLNNGASITNSGTLTFNDLTVADGATATTSASFSIAGSLTVGPAGQFTSTVGTLTFTGTAKTLYGTLSIANMTVSGSVTNYGTLTVGAALSGGGSLTQGVSSVGAYTGTNFATSASANTPFGIAAYNGFLWIAVATDKKVYQYTVDGNLTGASFDTSGSGDTNVGSIAYYNGFFWTTDATTKKIYKYNPDGSYTGSSYSFTAANSSAEGITGYNGFLWVTDSSGAKVYKYSATDGSYSGTSFAAAAGNTKPAGLSFYNGFFWIDDNTAAKVYQYNPDGSSAGWNFSTSGSGDTGAEGQTTYNDFFWIEDYAGKKVYKYNASASSGTLNIGGTSGITTLTATAVGNTVNYTGPSQAIKNTSYYNLTLSGSGTATGPVTAVNGVLATSGTVTWATGGNLTIGVHAAIGSNTTLLLNGYSLTLSSFTNSGTLVLVGTEPVNTAPNNLAGSTVTYNSAGTSIVMSSWVYQNLQINGPGGKFNVVVGSLTVNESLTLTAGMLDDTGGNFTIGVSSNWVNTGGVFNSGTSTVTFNGGTVGQTIRSHGSPFGNVQINNSAGFWTLIDSITVNSTMTLTAGTLDAQTNSQPIVLGGNLTIPTDGGDFEADTSTITFSGTSAQIINTLGNGAGQAYGVILDSNTTSGGVTFASSFTATGLTVNAAALPSATTVYFNAGSTFTVTNLNLIGSSANGVWIRPRPANQIWLLKNTSTNTVSYVDVAYSSASTNGGVLIVAGPNSTDSLNNTNWTFKILSVTFSPKSYDFTTVAIGGTTLSVNPITVTNGGNVTETYSLAVTTTGATVWGVGIATPTTALDTFVLEGLFNSVQPSTAVFTSMDVMTSTPTASASNVYKGDSSGVSTAVGSALKLWMLLFMPQYSSTLNQQTMTVTVTAGP